MIKELNLFATLNPINEEFEEKWKQLGDSLKMLSHGPVDIEIFTMGAVPSKVQWNEIQPNQPNAFCDNNTQIKFGSLPGGTPLPTKGKFRISQPNYLQNNLGSGISGLLQVKDDMLDLDLTWEGYNTLFQNTKNMTGIKFAFID